MMRDVERVEDPSSRKCLWKHLDERCSYQHALYSSNFQFSSADKCRHVPKFPTVLSYSSRCFFNFHLRFGI